MKDAKPKEVNESGTFPGRQGIPHLNNDVLTEQIKPSTPPQDGCHVCIPRLPHLEHFEGGAIPDMTGNFQVLTLDGPSAQLREHKKRRPHKKTKSGCLSCKVKKVKVCLYHCQRVT
jgi:hypothetical protein